MAPSLRCYNVILDNLYSHKRAPSRALFEAVGAALRFFRPYSPDFNPIEVETRKKLTLSGRARFTSWK